MRIRFRIPLQTVIALSLSAGVLTLSGALLSIDAPPSVSSSRPDVGQAPDARQAKVSIDEVYGKLPLAFEANHGQADPKVKFLARGRGYSLFLTGTEAVLGLRASGDSAHASAEIGQPATEESAGRLKNSSARGRTNTISMRLIGANPNPRVEGVAELPWRSNYLIGNDPDKWRTGVPNYEQVRYNAIYSGIDLVYYGKQGQLEYDFIVEPGADPSDVRLVFEGIESLKIDSQGNLVLRVSDSELLLHKPISYQENSGARLPVDGRFVLKGRREAGFRVATYDSRWPLVIDPVLNYSTYLGGGGTGVNANGEDLGRAIAVDSSGNVYVTGTTSSATFPTVNALQSVVSAGGTIFVSKFNPSGSALVYSTYLGGNQGGDGRALAVDSSGSVYITGSTGSSLSFPTVNPIQAAPGGATDSFALKLNPSGSALIYSTYLGGSGDDVGYGIAADSSGSAYITGYTLSSNFPTASPLQGSNQGDSDAFVAKLNAGGTSLLYSTYLGGQSTDHGYAIAVDASGSAYISGRTLSTLFPTVNPLQATLAGSSDAFVAKLNASGSALIFSTFLGGSGFESGLGIALDSLGNVYIAGNTTSSNFPTVSPLQASIGGGDDSFISKLSPAGSALVYSTYLGGSGTDSSNGIGVDSSGNAYVGGDTASSNFPTVSPLQTPGGGSDAMVAKLNSSGSALVYSTYLGGVSTDRGLAIAVDSSGSAYITGLTGSPNFPTASPFQASYGGLTDAFVAKISGAGAVSQLAFTVQPASGAASSAISPAVQVAVQDASGITVAGATHSITLAIGSNPGGGTLSGATTVSAANGVATFSNLGIDKAGTGYTLTANSGGLAGVTSSAFNITAGAASKLAFVVHPSNTVAGKVKTGEEAASAAVISPALQVAVQDALGNTVTTASNSIAVAIGSNPGGGSLSGTTTASASGGIATFSNLSIDKAGSGYTLTANASGLAGVTSNTFSITAGAASKLAFIVQPSNVIAGSAISPAVQVAVQDSVGNTVTGASSSIVLAIGANPGGGTLSGTSTVIAVSGVATFSNVSINKVGIGYTLTANSSGLSGATSDPFNVAIIVPTSVPTLSEWGLILLGGLLALAGIVALNRARLKIF